MADIISDGNTRVTWVTSIASKSAPTAAELNGGLTLQSTMTPDGLMNFQPSTNKVPNRKLDGLFETSDVGTTSFGDMGLKFYKQSGTDTIFNTLTKYTAGYVVVRKSIAVATAYATSQLVQVYPAKCGETSWLDPEADTEERYMIPILLTDSPVIRAVVA